MVAALDEDDEEDEAVEEEGGGVEKEEIGEEKTVEETKEEAVTKEAGELVVVKGGAEGEGEGEGVKKWRVVGVKDDPKAEVVDGLALAKAGTGLELEGRGSKEGFLKLGVLDSVEEGVRKTEEEGAFVGVPKAGVVDWPTCVLDAGAV